MGLVMMSVAAGGSAAHAGSGKIALTFDDLPALTLSTDQSYVNDLTSRLLSGLKRHHLPATGFVVEGKLDELNREAQIAVLRSWLEAGLDLGNHSFSHESPNSLGANAYVEDIARGEPVTRALLAEFHKTLAWYRFPYLETGNTAAVKHAIERWLIQHHYRIAPVTMNADDWEFSEPYDDAVAQGDLRRQQRIKQQYLQYTDRMINWYQKAARALFRRDISYVMLLHATRLDADCIDDFAALLKRHRLRGVTLAEAMRDPAYRTRDHYIGSDGIDWLERWSLVSKRELPWESFEDPPKDIQADYDRIDRDR
ncbi:polysaccharide deacetylase family protein [Sphingobium sp. H33]|uniref:Chitooligosaccharide deacetylase n=2 Tax=Sphingobium nicotianae TaxID=2782607 RepID=A0A9X1DC37_9SPHN|nr:polysaccharide deacetylase family protein [Sphingobium nicotianae]